MKRLANISTNATAPTSNINSQNRLPMIMRILALNIAMLILCITVTHQAHALENPVQTTASYIVLLDDTAVNPDNIGIESLSMNLMAKSGGTFTHSYEEAVFGFVADLTPEAVAVLLEKPEIAEVIPNDEFNIFEDVANLDASQELAWGLDRINQRVLPLDGAFNPSGDGSTVHVYTFDTGIRSTHSDFGGRVSGGHSTMTEDESTEDCHGHGTHVASVIGGTTYGVAKAVQLHPVRILKCNGGGSWATLLSGIDWLLNNHEKPAVVNMSLSGPANPVIERAIQKVIEAGITVVVGAGNKESDACDFTPPNIDSVITVGATTNTDNRASFSNRGACIDLFAPGNDILGAWETDDNATKVFDGTSVAAAHVTGAAALYLQANPDSTPAQVLSAIVENATPDQLTLENQVAQVGMVDESTDGEIGAIGTNQSSANLMLYAIFGNNAPTPTPQPTVSPTAVPPTAVPPTAVPTNLPTAVPTMVPTTTPSTTVPTAVPTAIPTTSPTTSPTMAPTTAPPTAMPSPTSPPPVAQDAILSVQPATTTLQVGELKTFAISVNPATSPLVNVWIHAQVDPNYVELVSVEANHAHLPRELAPLQFDATTGHLSYGASTRYGTISVPFDLLQITVKAVAPISQTAFSFLNTTPPTDIGGPDGSILQEARNALVTIHPTAGVGEATLDGYLGLQGRPLGTSPAKMIPLNVKLYTPDSDTLITSFDLSTDPDGHFIRHGLVPGLYDIELQSEHALISRVKNMALAEGENQFYLGTLLEGDLDQDNHITTADVAPMQAGFNRCKNTQALLARQDSTGFDARADLNQDTCTNIIDFGLLSNNFNRQGPVEYDAQNLSELPDLALQTATIGFEQGVRYMDVGESVQLGFFVTPKGSQVNGANVHLRFDPAIVEITTVQLVTDSLTTILEQPLVDNVEGVIRFSAGLLGGTLSDRFQMATITVKLKQETDGSSIFFPRAFPATNISGPTGPVLDTVEGIVISNNPDEEFGIDGVDFEVKTQLFLPIVNQVGAVAGQ